MNAAWDGILHAWLFWAAAPAGVLLLMAFSALRGATLADDQQRATECSCTHSFSLHEHLRDGTDCALCACPSFVAADVHRARTTPLPYQAGEHVTDLGEQLFDQDADDWAQWADELSTS